MLSTLCHLIRLLFPRLWELRGDIAGSGMLPSTPFLDPAVRDEYLGTTWSSGSCSKVSLPQDFLDLLKDVTDSLSCRSKLAMAIQM
jgi:hypothetical protein